MVSFINSELYEESLKVFKYLNIRLVRIQVLPIKIEYINAINSQCRLYTDRYLPAFQIEIA